MSRQAAAVALTALVNNAYAWATPVSTRLKMITDATIRPCCFVFEGGMEKYEWHNGAHPRRTIPFRLYIYTGAPDAVTSDAPLQDSILDALDLAMVPTGSDAAIGRNTLGGAAYNCQIRGTVLKVPGDLDGDGMIVVPVLVTLP